MIMNRCIVEGCTIVNDTKRKQTVTPRQNLLFKAPNDPDLLNKWRKALGQQIRPEDYVCEFHFKEDDVLKNLSTFTKVEGCKSLTFRKRFSLKLGAVPSSSMVRKDRLEIQKPNSQQKKEVGYISKDDEQIHDSDDDSVIELINGEESGNSNNNEVDRDASYQQNTVGQNVTQSPKSNNKHYQKQSRNNTSHKDQSNQLIEKCIIRIPCEDDPQQSESKQSTKEKIVSNYVKNGVVIKRVIQSSQPNDVNNQTKTMCQKRKLNNSPQVINKLYKPDVNISPCEPYSSAEAVRRTRISFNPSKKLDNIDELKLILRHTCIRSQWCAKIEETSVFFSYVDFDKARVNCCLEIDEDFSVNAYTADKAIAIYVTTTDGVKCINEIIEVMKVLEKKRWCLGPGVPLLNRSPDCIGAMPIKSVSDSCVACIKEKLNSLTHTRELANCKIKLEESRHKCELMRKKHHYATTQYERLKAENKILEYQVDQAKKIAINDVLNRLPPLQKQVVRYMINGSYTKTSLRYSTTWINECIVMRAMSPAMYEYMRRKNILPLPCPDTLKKHKFKIILDKDPNASDSGDSIDYTKLPESPELPVEVEDPLEIPQSSKIVESPEMSESVEMLALADMPDLTEISESTEIIAVPERPYSEMPQSIDADGYTTVLEFIPDYMVSEEVAYEVTVSTESVEE